MGSVGAALRWQHRRNGESTSASHANRLGRCAEVVILFHFASAAGSRDGSRNPRMGAKCALRHDRPPAPSFARSLTYSLASITKEIRSHAGSNFEALRSERVAQWCFYASSRGGGGAHIQWLRRSPSSGRGPRRLLRARAAHARRRRVCPTRRLRHPRII